jgi:hypothetical protein
VAFDATEFCAYNHKPALRESGNMYFIHIKAQAKFPIPMSHNCNTAHGKACLLGFFVSFMHCGPALKSISLALKPFAI